LYPCYTAASIQDKGATKVGTILMLHSSKHRCRVACRTVVAVFLFLYAATGLLKSAVNASRLFGS